MPTHPNLEKRVTPKPGDMVFIVCEEDGVEVHREFLFFSAAAPFGSVFAAEDAAVVARNTIPLPSPDIRTAPPANTAQLVGLATWLWVANPWETLTASASAGNVTATITATPTRVDWNPGDGTPTVTCDGPGSAWDPSQPDRTSDCTHLYTVRSTITDPDGTYPLTATITYNITWTATNGQGGTLDPLTRTTTIPILVQEAQALIR